MAISHGQEVWSSSSQALLAVIATSPQPSDLLQSSCKGTVDSELAEQL